MNLYENIVIIATLAIFITYFNYRFLSMQPTIAVMATSLFLSFILLFLDKIGLHVIHDNVTVFINRFHFHDALMNCMLGLLLFAGSLTIDMPYFKNQKWDIGILAVFSTIASTFLVGIGIYFILNLLGLHVELIFTMLFGALISPTDPIAILAISKKCGMSKKLEMLLMGESLFNDGVGVVLFITFYYAAFSDTQVSLLSILTIFFKQVLGGLAFGICLGVLAKKLMTPIDEHKIEILLTIAIVVGGYTLAQMLDISGPLAMVAAGVYIANHKDKIFKSTKTREHFESFWELIDELLNAVLFLLIGFEVLLIHFTFWHLLASALVIPLVLLIRLLTVAIPMRYMKQYPSNTIRVLTWGGLRGGIAVALALSIPPGAINDIILPMTYIVVIFSVLIQGTTICFLKRTDYPKT